MDSIAPRTTRPQVLEHGRQTLDGGSSMAYETCRAMTMPTLATIERGSFGGHETFPLRYTWLRKAVQHVERDPRIFNDDDAMVRLGVGKNMVRSIKHWALVCGVLEEDPEIANNRGRVLRPTALGHALFDDEGWDPYLEDPATLWLLHYELASSPDQTTTWYLVFNHLPQPELTKTELLGWLSKLAQERAWPRVSPASLRRDVEVFLRTYVPSRASRIVPLEATGSVHALACASPARFVS